MTKVSQAEAKQLESMKSARDDMPEKEIHIDAKELQKAFTKLRETQEKAYAEKKEKAKELAKITVQKDDVKLVSAELDLTTEEATLLLKESNGDVKECLLKFVNRPANPPVKSE